MSDFAHDIAGGQGNLIVTSVQSPNFVHGSSGWQIKKDGSAEFNNGTFRGTVTAATIIGSLVESASSGRRTTLDSNGDIKVYNASGAVLLWFQNSTDALFFYTDTGSSTQGSLVCSIANAAGTDPFGNSYLAGNASYAATFATALNAGFVAFYAGSLAAGWTLESSVAGDAAGNLQVNATGQLQLIGTGGVTIQGSANTGACNNNLFGLTTSGASAGTAHTHTLPFQNPTATHTHPV